ncbi:hypothetical protein CIB84_008766 [Bambusicola thoracicus]|uniref:Uncharacterized protein n=1 Tax=Bambusicola thoracicus TaxID=9083 RepID=A0A2P4STR6_BAMTH|nr:hypothetical protein CIB84_008766 [Bambusicola thoracicus]
MSSKSPRCVGNMASN